MSPKKITSTELIEILLSDRTTLKTFKKAYYTLHPGHKSEFHNLFLEKVPLKADLVEFIIQELPVNPQENSGSLLIPLYGAFRTSSQRPEIPEISEEIIKYLKVLVRCNLKLETLQLGQVCPRLGVLKYLIELNVLTIEKQSGWLRDALGRIGYREEVLLFLEEPTLEDIYRESYLSILDPSLLGILEVRDLYPSDFLQVFQKAVGSSSPIDFPNLTETWLNELRGRSFTIQDSEAIVLILVTVYVEGSPEQRISLEGALDVLITRGRISPSPGVLRENLGRLILDSEIPPPPKMTHLFLGISEEFKKLSIYLWFLGKTKPDHIREVLEIEGMSIRQPEFPALQDLPLQWPGNFDLNLQRARSFPLDPSQVDLPSLLIRNGCISLLHTPNTKLDSFKYALIAAIRLRDFPEELRGKAKNKVARHYTALEYRKLLIFDRMPSKVPLDPDYYRSFEEDNPKVQLNVFAYDEGRSFLFPVYRGTTNLQSSPLDLLYYHSYYHPIEDLEKAAKSSINLVEGKEYVVRISRPCLKTSTDRRRDGAARKAEEHKDQCQCFD